MREGYGGSTEKNYLSAGLLYKMKWGLDAGRALDTRYSIEIPLSRTLND